MKSPVGSRRTNKNLDLRAQLGPQVTRVRLAQRARWGLKGRQEPQAQGERGANPAHRGLPDSTVTRELKDLPGRLVRREIQEVQVPLDRKEIRVPKATQVRKVGRDLPA
jgi:hypothetical protein